MIVLLGLLLIYVYIAGNTTITEERIGGFRLHTQIFSKIQYIKKWYSHTFYYEIQTIYIDIIKCLLQSSKYLNNIETLQYLL